MIAADPRGTGPGRWLLGRPGGSFAVRAAAVGWALGLAGGLPPRPSVAQEEPGGMGAEGDADDGGFVYEDEATDVPVAPPAGSGPAGEGRRPRQTVTLGQGGGPGAPPREVPNSHTVRQGDTLWDITGRYFGNPWMWPRVWSYNPEITNPHWIYPDGTVRLRPGTGVPTVDEARVASAEPTGIQVAQGPAGRRVPGAIVLREEGFLDRQALDAAGRIVGSPEEHMLLATYDEIYIRFDQGEPRPGQELAVFRRVGDDERIEGEEGELVRILGGVRIRSYDEDRRVATGVITETFDPIERGFLVGDLPRRFELVPPVRNTTSLEAEVVATLRPRELLGDYQILFVDVGEENGLRMGNRFFILRDADEWRASLSSGEDRLGATAPDTPRIDDPPPEVIAEARVVTLRPTTAGLMVTNSTRPVVLGDLAVLREGY